MIRFDFPNGVFGDPALYLDFEHFACLVDCGDLSRFTQKQLLKIQALFVSHCHMDHFMDFDRLLRAHMGSEKSIEIIGPPDLISKISGKLQAYTWNLMDQSLLEFRVTELDFKKGIKRTSLLPAAQSFQASPILESALRNLPFFLTSREGLSYGPEIHWCELDHRTPSLAFRFTQTKRPRVNIDVLKEKNIKEGPWLGALLKKENTEETLSIEGHQIPTQLLFTKDRSFSVAYVTDGAANSENYEKLFDLCLECDVLFAETCFLEVDVEKASQTKHFIASFIGKLATQARVITLAPFHFSKRYRVDRLQVYSELSSHYSGAILKLSERT